MSNNNEHVVVCQTFEEYVAQQMADMLSPFNLWVTGIAIGHQPSADEAAEHYERCGGSDHFRETHIRGDVK